MPLAVVVALIVFAIGIFVRLAKRRRALVIRSPRFGILNLKGAPAESIIAMDVEALRPVLGHPVRGTGPLPFCDVAFIYCDVALDGKVENYPGTLRDLIHKLRAPLVVVASENPGAAYVASTKIRSHGRANLVMTLSRRDGAFVEFFSLLFADMKRGVSMPLAWVKLAPQGSDREHENLPSTIFACELGGLMFDDVA